MQPETGAGIPQGSSRGRKSLVEQIVGDSQANFGTIGFGYTNANNTALPNYSVYSQHNSPNATAGGINGSGGFDAMWHHC